MLATAMFGLQQETPSRILRRIRAAEADDDEMPTLPSLPGSANSSVGDSTGGASLVVRRRPTRPGLAQATSRNILSPLNANRKREVYSAANGGDAGSAPSPKGTSSAARKRAAAASKPGLVAASPISAQRPPQHRQQHQPSVPPTVVSTASSVRTLRPAAGKDSSRTGRDQQIGLATASSRSRDISYASQEGGAHKSDDTDGYGDASASRRNSLDEGLSALNALDDSDDMVPPATSGAVPELAHDQQPEVSLESSSSPADEAHQPQHPTTEEADNEDVSSPDQVDLPLSDSSVSHREGSSGPASEERIAQHVVLRRRANPILARRTASTGQLVPIASSPLSDASDTPAQQEGSLAIRASPEASLGSTPGVGRRLPSAERNRYGASTYDVSVSYADDRETPLKAARFEAGASRTSSAPPSTAVSSRAYSDNFATPRPASSDADLERRKSHLLSTLRLTALRSAVKPKLKKGTPHPHQMQARRSRSLTPAITFADESGNASVLPDDQDDEDGGAPGEDLTTASSAASTSSNDLTTHPRGTGNTSLPLTGGVAGVPQTRFNGAKLNNYLHTLNTHLSEENQNLVKTLEETAREVQRLMDRNRELSTLVDETTSTREHTDNISRDQSVRQRDNEGDLTREMLAGHQRTRDDIGRIREHLVGDESRGDASMQSLRGLQIDNARMEGLVDQLQTETKEKDVEIAALRAQILRQTAENDNTSSVMVTSLQQQVFALTDDLANARSEIAVSNAEVTRLRADQLETAQRNTSAIADLQGRTDELLLLLEEKDGQLDEAQRTLEEQDEGFKEKMRNLETDLCKVMEEQEGQLKDARREAETLKADLDRAGHQVQDAKAQLGEAEKSVMTLQADKRGLQNLLDVATSSAPHHSPADKHLHQERIALLQKDVANLQDRLQAKEAALDGVQREATTAAFQAKEELQDLHAQLEEAKLQSKQAVRKLAAQTTVLAEAEAALEESEANLRNATSQALRLTRQVEDGQAAMSQLQREQHNASFAALESETQKKLDAAQREIGNLRLQLASPALPAHREPNADVKDLEIRTLRSSNHELETRVGQLKRQAMLYERQSFPSPSGSNRSASGQGLSSTPEKSVRFDSVKSLKTPRSVTQMLGSMSFLDKTDGNMTVAPLYAEIDGLHDRVKQYQALLQAANDEVDDKLQKLGRAGNDSVEITKELSDARKQIRKLEERLRDSGSVDEVRRLSVQLRETEADLRATRHQLSRITSSDTHGVVQELRAVRDQLASERGDLMRRLGDIKQHCQQISSQLDTSRASQAETQRSLDAQVAETRRLRQKLESSHGAFSTLDAQHQALVEERDSILQGVGALKRDLNRVQQDAAELGEDIKLAKQPALAVAGNAVAYGGGAICNKAGCLDRATRSKEEAKGLLVMIKYLKAKFVRESYLRADLAHQKLYLSMVIDQKTRLINATNATLARFGMPPPLEETGAGRSKQRPGLRAVANLVISTIRMRRLAEGWQRQSAVKGALRDAYQQTRGKPFVPSA